MSDTAGVDEEVEPVEETDPETDPDETETEPEPETDEDPEDPEAEGRCETETTAGGTVYRCSLQAGHEGEHSFQPVDATDTGDEDEEKLTDEQQEQARKLAQRAKSYGKSVVDLLGEDLSGWVACEVCAPYHPGLHPPFNVLGGAPAEVVAACRTIAGLPSLDNMTQDRYATTCRTCGGVGRTLTGSNVQGQETIRCRDCEGKGWTPVGSERQAEHKAQPTLTAPSGDGGDEPEASDVDPWGRPYGDPLYGVMPGFEHAHGA